MKNKKQTVLAVTVTVVILALLAVFYFGAKSKEKKLSIPTPENYKIEVADEVDSSYFKPEGYEPLSQHTEQMHPDYDGMTFAQANLVSNGFCRYYISNEMHRVRTDDGKEYYLCGNNQEMYYTFNPEAEAADCFIKKDYEMPSVFKKTVKEVYIANTDTDILNDKTGVPRVNTKTAKKITDEQQINNFLELFKNKGSDFNYLIGQNGLDESGQYVFLAGFEDGLFCQYIGSTTKADGNQSK